ncbi:MAG: glycosyltransferase family 4 protein [Flavobacterium sp.]
MKHLLYIGNKLEKKGRSASTIDTLGPLLEAEGYKVRYTSSNLNIATRFISMLNATFRYGPKSNFVLIDTYSTLNFYYAFFCSQICRMLNVQYIPLLHGGDLPIRLTKSPRMSKMIFDNAYLNISPSSFLKTKFEEAGFKNIKEIPNNISLHDFPYQRRNSVAPKLIWVRAMADIYNPKMALEVLKILQTDFPGISLTMVGPDKENIMPDLLSFAQSEKLNVNFTGKLSRKEWSELSKDSSIFINTSNFDNMPVSLLEAAALGLSIVSTNVGGIPYLFEHSKTALLSDANDSVQMAENIRLLLSDKDLQQTLQRNSYEFVQQFDWQKVKGKWHEIFQNAENLC